MNISHNAPTVLWDMDNTLFDWSTRFHDIAVAIDPSFPVVPEGERVGFDYFWIPEANPATIMAALNHPDLYDDLDPIPGTIEAYLEMSEAGIDSDVVQPRVCPRQAGKRHQAHGQR